MDRDQLETFASIVELKSFERAAAILNISRGAVSQRIKALEESLSVVLLVRDKPVIPTERGEVLLRHVKALQLLESASLAELMPSIDGRPVQIAVAVNADSLATWFPSVLWPLLREQNVALEVVSDDQDHTLPRLARGEVIGCISTSSKPSAGFNAVPLGCMEYRCFAARTFSNQYFPQGITVHSALKAPALLFNKKDSLHDDFLVNLFGVRIEKYTKHYLPASTTLLDGVVAGVGYGLVPNMQVTTQHLDMLIDLAPDQPVMVPLYWHHWLAEPPQLKMITTIIVSKAAAALAGC
jgi:LysR family transcriptional regulator, chromosome initiation inhibitor